MKRTSLLTLVGICGFIFLASGCVPQEEHDSLREQNRRQSGKIDTMTGELRGAELLLKQCRGRLDTAKGLTGPEMEALGEEITLLKEDVARKLDIIKRLKAELLRGGIQLPMELSLALKDFAEKNDMVSFDEGTGVLKFKSDLLFRSGSAKVVDAAKSGISSLGGIMNSEQASQFDLVIAGHTDSDPIRYSKGEHPTNWHLSSHRAIAVLEMMVANGVSPKRLSSRGFGQQKPLESNDSKEGKAANRRVEIYVVSEGR
jgi:chemotaxis protein MotB